MKMINDGSPMMQLAVRNKDVTFVALISGKTVEDARKSAESVFRNTATMGITESYRYYQYWLAGIREEFDPQTDVEAYATALFLLFTDLVRPEYVQTSSLAEAKWALVDQLLEVIIRVPYDGYLENRFLFLVYHEFFYSDQKSQGHFESKARKAFAEITPDKAIRLLRALHPAENHPQLSSVIHFRWRISSFLVQRMLFGHSTVGRNNDLIIGEIAYLLSTSEGKLVLSDVVESIKWLADTTKAAVQLQNYLGQAQYLKCEVANLIIGLDKKRWAIVVSGTLTFNGLPPDSPITDLVHRQDQVLTNLRRVVSQWRQEFGCSETIVVELSCSPLMANASGRKWHNGPID